ncbi:MAG: HopJ type effector protein [Moraxellaceae bacterium]|nr:HopJ type effector protein [Moraxellaceae bacterium]MDF3030954.1 HopJ type effector protein [Moraxellaceae bacterium]
MIFSTLLDRLDQGTADFEDVIAYLNEHYDYTPTRFSNGLGADPVINEAGKNEGSCRLFALARLKGLSEADTVKLFGRFYRDDVLKHPGGSDHANIRRFLRDGWAGIHFEGEALQPKGD